MKRAVLSIRRLHYATRCLNSKPNRTAARRDVGRRVAGKRSANTRTAVGPAFAYDDRSLSGCITTMAKSALTMPQSGSRSNRFAAFHVYGSLRRQVAHTSQESSGKERDGETGLDYFGARYFSGAMGRFTSPDAPLVFASRQNPQSWNLYSYGLNNPLRYTDPTGHFAVEGSGACEGQKLCSEAPKVVRPPTTPEGL